MHSELARIVCSLASKQDLFVAGVLIGNKCDLQERCVVPSEQAEEWAQTHGLQFFEVSAVTFTVHFPSAASFGVKRAYAYRNGSGMHISLLCSRVRIASDYLDCNLLSQQQFSLPLGTS